MLLLPRHSRRVPASRRPRATWLFVAIACLAGPAHATDHAPGDALHPPDRSIVAPEHRAPRWNRSATAAEGLYSYITPFAPPRWIRVQQAGDLVWGTIDVNDSFGMCTRQRFDGTLEGNLIAFYVPLEESACPCNGTGAGLSFNGVVDGNGHIVGAWSNACSANGTWDACLVTGESPGEGTETCFLPDNPAPPAVRQTPAGGGWLWGLLGLGLALVALPAIAPRGLERMRGGTA